jgi:hypothetical protein
MTHGEFLCGHQHINAFKAVKDGDLVLHVLKAIPQGLKPS